MSILDMSFKWQSLFGLAWSCVKGSKSAFWRGLLLCLLIGIVIAGVEFYLLSSLNFGADRKKLILFSIVLTSISELVIYMITAPFAAGLMLLSLKLVRGEPWSKNEAFKHIHLWKASALALFYQHGITLVLGLVIALLPLPAEVHAHWLSWVVSGVINLFFMLNIVVLVDKNCSAWEATKRSCQLMKSHLLKGLIVLVVLVLVNIVAALLLLIGLIWALPFSLLVIAYFYCYVCEQPVKSM